MTAPTGQAREILNLAPAAPPRPANVRHQFGVIFRRTCIFLPLVWSDFRRVCIFFKKYVFFMKVTEFGVL